MRYIQFQRIPTSATESNAIHQIPTLSNQFQPIPIMLTQIHAEYTFEELQAELNRVRDGGMPRSTLYYWLKRLKMMPNESGFYTQDDLDILKDLNRFLKRCPSIAKFEKIHLSA